MAEVKLNLRLSVNSNGDIVINKEDLFNIVDILENDGDDEVLTEFLEELGFMILKLAIDSEEDNTFSIDASNNIM